MLLVTTNWLTTTSFKKRLYDGFQFSLGVPILAL